VPAILSTRILGIVAGPRGVNVSELSSAVGQRAVLPGKLAQHGNKGQQLSVV
jgi:hypothetical protein